MATPDPEMLMERGRKLFAGPCDFIWAASKIDGLPPLGPAEIAFAGRSNAGKSSAINTLANHNRLAFVSKTPGRTQLLNYFDLGDQRYLVDLPGYGYAKVPAAVRAPWERLLGRYMLEREQLKGLALIMDIRHPFTEHDDRLLNWFAPSGKPVHILLTKADKLSRTEANQVLRDAFAVRGDAPALAAGGQAIPLLSPKGERYVAHILPLSSVLRNRSERSSDAVGALLLRKVALGGVFYLS